MLLMNFDPSLRAKAYSLFVFSDGGVMALVKLSADRSMPNATPTSAIFDWTKLAAAETTFSPSMACSIFSHVTPLASLRASSSSITAFSAAASAVMSASFCSLG